MKTTGYIVKASLEKYKYLLTLQKSKEPLNLIGFSVVSKPLKYGKPSKKKKMNLVPGDLLFMIEDVEENDIIKHKKFFVPGEYCQIEELKLIQRDRKVFMEGIDFVPDEKFLHKLVIRAGMLPEEPAKESQA
ncbi:MAG: hypothetical protein H8E81_03445 [Deltaproteobacteria bacterium]|nr:hypothetical protein [Deltaproteobacteria bacterium]